MEQPSTSPTESWWWCFRCHAFVDVDDPGEIWPKCAECGCRKIELRKRPSTPDRIHTSGELAKQWFERMRAVIDHPQEGEQ